MSSDQLYTTVPAITARRVPVSGRQSIILQIRLVAGYLLVAAYGAVLTYGQYYLCVRLRPPWREVLLIASLLVEYAGLARLSAWMYRWVDIPRLIGQHTQHEWPIVLASCGAPGVADVETAGQVARMLDRPVLLVNLVTPTGNEDRSWIEDVWARLAGQGVRVSAESILTQRPQDTLREIMAGTRAPCIVTGQLGKLAQDLHPVPDPLLDHTGQTLA